MRPIAETSILTCQWEDLPLAKVPDAQQVEKMQTYLDLALLSLESLVGINSQTILQAAQELNLGSVIPDSAALWQLRQCNPLRQGVEERQLLDVEEMRSLVLIICHLARQHQELIRRAVTLLEQVAAQDRAPQQTALLGRYLDNFSRACVGARQCLAPTGGGRSAEWLSELALRLPIDLLFYSAPSGHRCLWLSLLAAPV